MLKPFLEEFARIIAEKNKTGLMTREWATNGYWNGSRWLHGVMWGAMVQAVPRKLTPLVEPVTSDFRPDLVIINDKHEKLAVIEYESTNSSDERLIVRDLCRFRDAILEYADRAQHRDDPGWVLPKLWLVISTLPNCCATDLPWHRYSMKGVHPEVATSKVKTERDENPLRYYGEHMHRACGETWASACRVMGDLENEGVQLVWANIDENHIRVRNVNGCRVAEDSIAFRLFS